MLNQAPGGGLPLLSPANTYGCLTEPCAGDEPEKYYPSGKRNYARVAPSDPNQGAVDAEFLESQGVKRVSVLNDKEAYGLGVAKNFAGAAKAAGMTVTGFTAYDPKPANFQALVHADQGPEPGRDLHRRPDRREQRPADQRQGRDSRAEQQQPSS